MSKLVTLLDHSGHLTYTTKQHNKRAFELTERGKELAIHVKKANDVASK